jgi:hypothetical protein
LFRALGGGWQQAGLSTPLRTE